jgi:hypothetical protein
MSFEAESNSELTVIVPAYQLHFQFPVQNKIHKQKILSDTRTGILSSIAGPCDFLPARSNEFKKVWNLEYNIIILDTEPRLIWYIITLPISKTRVPKVQKWMLLLFVQFIFHLILMGYFLMNSLGKSLSDKCIALQCNHYKRPQ